MNFFQDQYHVNLTGVRSMVICPGLTDTGLVKEIRKQLMSSEYEAAWQRDNANCKIQRQVNLIFELQILDLST